MRGGGGGGGGVLSWNGPTSGLNIGNGQDKTTNLLQQMQLQGYLLMQLSDNGDTSWPRA